MQFEWKSPLDESDVTPEIRGQNGHVVGFGRFGQRKTVAGRKRVIGGVQGQNRDLDPVQLAFDAGVFVILDHVVVAEQRRSEARVKLTDRP